MRQKLVVAVAAVSLVGGGPAQAAFDNCGGSTGNSLATMVGCLPVKHGALGDYLNPYVIMRFSRLVDLTKWQECTAHVVLWRDGGPVDELPFDCLLNARAGDDDVRYRMPVCHPSADSHTYYTTGYWTGLYNGSPVRSPDSATSVTVAGRGTVVTTARLECDLPPVTCSVCAVLAEAGQVTVARRVSVPEPPAEWTRTYQ